MLRVVISSFWHWNIFVRDMKALIEVYTTTA